MSSEALAYVFENSQTDGRARVLMLAIADGAGDDGEFWPNKSRLSLKCNIPAHTVGRLMDYCIQIGEICVQPGTPPRYFIVGLKKTSEPSAGYRKSLLSRYGARLAARDGGWKCHYCGVELPKFYDPDAAAEQRPTIDHIVPVSRGGDDNPDNLVLACQSCNSSKGSQPYAEFIGGAS